MNHSIHNLASMPINAASINTSFNSKKQLQHQLMSHHTLQHNNTGINNQLVNNLNFNTSTNNNNNNNTSWHHQQMLQFHQNPALHHPYSTLHTSTTNQHPHLHNHNHSNSSSMGSSTTATTATTTGYPHHNTANNNTSNNNNNNNLISNLNTIASQSMHFNHGLPANLQHQLAASSMNNNNHSPQQQQYNMNSSDYSSSTYHIYDQISDLIIIKQQRMERKRQQEQKRKVILISLAVIILVGTIMFLSIQSLFASTSPSSSSSSSAAAVATTTTTSSSSTSSLQREGQNNHHNNNNIDLMNDVTGSVKWPPMMAPPVGVPSRFPQGPIIQLPNININNNNNNNNNGIKKLTTIESCGEHGSVVTTTVDSFPVYQCKCDYGYFGEHCEYIVSYQPPESSSSSHQQAPESPSSSPQPPLESSSSSPQQNLTELLLSRCVMATNNCNGRGQCNNQGRCQCYAGSTGDDCGQSIERQCDDGIDNDRDGLVDCADSECCSDKFCQNSTLCMKSPDPLDILMRKQPPPPTSSFFQRMQFLIEKSSSQKYSNPKDFSDTILTSKYVDRASVIRGRVTYLKQGVTGVRVSVAGQINLGITLTRDGGYFDLMVNGGGSVVIEFRREPFSTLQKAVRVPWNEIVLIDPIELKLDSQTSAELASSSQKQQDLSSSTETDNNQQPTCLIHNYRLMRPHIVTAPKSSKKSHSYHRQLLKSTTSNSRAIILRESGMVQQSIVLPASTGTSTALPNEINNNNLNESVSLVYISSRANEFMSTINIQLVPQTNQVPIKLPEELKLIHLKIVIEGNLFEQLFEPQTNLTFTYAWNRRNVYRQKSFGLSTASVSVGYEYFDCKHIIWTTKQIHLPGHDLSISDIGQQWNLNIHHRYNYRDSILQRGDGQNFNLKTDKARVVQPIIGDGYPRPAQCPYCDGTTTQSEQRLLKPQALISAPDGSIYVGDFNLIRKIEFINPGSTSSPSTQASSSSSSSAAASQAQALTTTTTGAGGELSSGRASRSPSTSSSSSIITKTILELPTTRVPSKYSLALNTIENKLYMSDQDRAQIYQIKEQNSDGARLMQSSDNNNDNNSSTDESLSLMPVVGSGIKCQLETDRSNCGDGHLARLARLIEPKAIAFDLNDKMYIADGPNVRMVTSDKKIYTILGSYGLMRAHQLQQQKFPCTGEAIPMHKFIPKDPKDLALNPIDETLHILDDNVVYKITQDKRVQIVAGRLAHCQQPPTTLAYNFDILDKNSRKLKATEVYLQSAQSITFNQNGDLFISESDELSKQQSFGARVLIVSPEEDSISLYAGQAIDSSILKSASTNSNIGLLLPTVDFNYYIDLLKEDDLLLSLAGGSQRSSNILPSSQQTTRALDYKFNSISAMTIDQQGKLLLADKLQLRLLSIEPDLPQINANGEYELQSPDNSDELLIFNRFGHHIATREISSGHAQRQTNNKYTFQYNVNTSFGQLASVSYSTGNKITIYRDGPHHNVKMIETAYGGQCKLDIGRNGQVHSISTIAPSSSKTNFSYHVDGGLLKQSRDQASGELFDFQYDEFGHAIGILHSSPKLSAPVECRFNHQSVAAAAAALARRRIPTATTSNYIVDFSSPDCSELIVAE